MKAETIPPVKHRIESIDVLRGAIMLIMALDHVRDYFHLGHPEATDLATTTSFLFFTRWITHFCAPTFVFLSGVSAFLAGTRRTKAQLSAFLIKRGLFLMVVEFVFINFSMNVDPGFHLFVFQVIWAIGGSMILLGLLVWAPLPVIGVIGAIIFFGHNVFDYVSVGKLGDTLAWKLLVSSKGFGTYWAVGADRGLLLAYALLPWTGVMLIGYVFGTLYKTGVDGVHRRKTLFLTGTALLMLFFLLRAFNIYGDPAPWAIQRTAPLSVVSFFNVSKYPCSLLYLCMTLGCALLILASIETLRNNFTRILITYGNVPLFYYLCHWYLIRVATLIVALSQGFDIRDIFSHFDSPSTFGFSLFYVYLLWLAVIALLYLPCRWYSKFKKTHDYWWLSYL